MCLAPREPSWIKLTLDLDAAGCHEPRFQWIADPAEALKRLRHESFDCLLVQEQSRVGVLDPRDRLTADPSEIESRNITSSGTPAVDALSFVHGVRASGCDDPITVLVSRLDEERLGAFYEYGCELLLSPDPWESPALLPVIRRGISRVEQCRENHRLATSQSRRLSRERDEAEHLLGEQRQIVREPEEEPEDVLTEAARDEESAAVTIHREAVRSAGNVRQRTRLPAEIELYYGELLRTYVIMGSGNLAAELSNLGELLALAGIGLREALELHLERVEQLVRGLGNRSARHVMTRADLLALELMIHLGERYRENVLAGDETARQKGDPSGGK